MTRYTYEDMDLCGHNAFAFKFVRMYIFLPTVIVIFIGMLNGLVVLLALLAAAHSCATSFRGALSPSQEKEKACLAGHRLVALGVFHDNGWKCNGLAGTCQSGIMAFGQTHGMIRFRCASCDFDLCRKCYDLYGNFDFSGDPEELADYPVALGYVPTGAKIKCGEKVDPAGRKHPKWALNGLAPSDPRALL